MGSRGDVEPMVALAVGLARAGHHPRVLGLAAVGEAGANVLEVTHARTSPSLAVDEVEVTLQLETRSAGHAGEVRDALLAAGFRVRA